MRWLWYSSGTTVQGRIPLPHTGQVIIGRANFLDLCADADKNEPMRAGRSRFPQEMRLQRGPRTMPGTGTGVHGAGQLESLGPISFCNAPCESDQK
jgi:hypothetical protein